MGKRPNAAQKRGRAQMQMQREIAMSQRVEASIVLHDPADKTPDERPRCEATGTVKDVTAQCYLTDGHEGQHRGWTTISGDFKFSVPNPTTPS